jgi:hypothetical protein
MRKGAGSTGHVGGQRELGHIGQVEYVEEEGIVLEIGGSGDVKRDPHRAVRRSV